MPNGLTVLAALRPGAEEPLRKVLHAIGDDIKGKTVAGQAARPHIDFIRSRNVHFARFAILDDPGRGPNRSRLLFSSNYDSDLEGHLAELVEITSDMQAIWGGCEAYSGIATFSAFIRAHAQRPEAFYIAFRDETAESIRAALAGSRQWELASADRPWTFANALADAARRFMRGVRRLMRALPIVADVVRAIGRLGFTNVFRASARIIASLNRYAVFRFVNWITRNRMPARKSPYSSVVLDNCASWQPVGAGDELPASSGGGMLSTFREDVVTQNQLTVVTMVDPRHVDRVKAVMAAIDSYAKRLSPPGSLIGISTIHFVRWLLIDENRRLILLSDYDGSWENYIDEFAEMILSGLDAIWETSFGFPPDGARDLPAFKRFLRVHQVPSEVFFSVYPDATTLNVRNDLELARRIGRGTPQPANNRISSE